MYQRFAMIYLFFFNDALSLEPFPFRSNRNGALSLCLSMIFFAKQVSTFADHALAAKPQQQTDPQAKHLISKEKEYRCQYRHDHDHDRRDEGFISGRPRHFRRFRPDLLNKFEGVYFRHAGIPRPPRPGK